MNLLYSINVKNVDFSYGDHKILSGLSLCIRRGERVCLSAASGAGKTTLLRLICGLETPNCGEISVNGEIFCLFQEDRLIPNLSAADNIRFIGASREEALSALDAVGLGDAAELKPRELSGGMRRRTAIARLCAFGALRAGNSGQILLLDEPFSGLDADSRRLSADAILRVFPDAAMLLITHAPEDAELLGVSRNEDAAFAEMTSFPGMTTFPEMTTFPGE